MPTLAPDIEHETVEGVEQVLVERPFKLKIPVISTVPTHFLTNSQKAALDRLTRELKERNGEVREVEADSRGTVYFFLHTGEKRKRLSEVLAVGKRGAATRYSRLGELGEPSKAYKDKYAKINENYYIAADE